MTRTYCHGFTLIELSLVLLVIGLLVSGVLAGTDLIWAAKVRRQVAFVEEVKTVMNAFRDKYDCIAGDCPRAGAVGLSAVAGYTGAINGDGNGIIDDDPWANRFESGLLLAHLTSSRLASWRIGASGAYLYLLSPRGLWENGQAFAYLPDADVWWPGAAVPPGSGYWVLNMAGVVGDAVQAFRIDNKHDDGRGFTGRIKIMHDELDLMAASACVDSVGEYRKSGASLDYCHVYFDLPH